MDSFLRKVVEVGGFLGARIAFKGDTGTLDRASEFFCNDSFCRRRRVLPSDPS